MFQYLSHLLVSSEFLFVTELFPNDFLLFPGSHFNWFLFSFHLHYVQFFYSELQLTFSLEWSISLFPSVLNFFFFFFNSFSLLLASFEVMNKNLRFQYYFIFKAYWIKDSARKINSFCRRWINLKRNDEHTLGKLYVSIRIFLNWENAIELRYLCHVIDYRIKFVHNIQRCTANFYCHI